MDVVAAGHVQLNAAAVGCTTRGGGRPGSIFSPDADTSDMPDEKNEDLPPPLQNAEERARETHDAVERVRRNIEEDAQPKPPDEPDPGLNRATP